jgi:Mg-chelatase subunit ChlD
MTKSLRKSLFTIAILTASAGTVAVAAGLNPFAGKSARPTTQPVAVVPSYDQPKPVVANGNRNVDIVFAVDTTGSMTQLIEGAKATVWSIAKHTQKMAPNAKIRIGLVAYRDIGEAYVTKTFQLSDDLDAAFAELSAYTAMGGGDVPENVNKALDEAINHMSWDDNAAKMVFLVGDAPGAERGDAPVLSALTAQANNKHITINAIRCGDDAATANEFKQLAMAAGGEFSSIAQSGGVQQIATPYDAKLAELADSIDATNVYYGGADGQAAAEGKKAINAAAPAAARADRAAYNAGTGGGRGTYGDADIVGGYAQGAIKLDALEEDKLPVEIRGKGKAEQAAWITAKAETRRKLEAQLLELQKQREVYIRDNAKPADEGFDAKVKGAVEKSLSAH